MSRFVEALAAGRLLTAELTPPRSQDPAALLDVARSWAGAVDAVHVNDCLLATARMSNLAVAALLGPTGCEPVLQITLRHRNRIAMQADLLGMHAVGVRGLVMLSGYAIKMGSDPGAKESGDLRSAEAIRLVRALSDDGVLFNGDVLDPPPRFSVGAVEHIGPGDPAAQVARVEAKIATGAEWLQVQGAFDVEAAVAWFDAMHAAGIHERVRLVGGVIPFASRAKLEVLDAVPGVTVSASAWARMAVRDTEAEGFAFATELARALYEHPAVSGVHVRPFGWESVVPALAAEVREAVPA